MIDYFALALMHGLIAIAVIRLLGRDALDRDPVADETGKDTATGAKAKTSSRAKSDRAGRARRRRRGRHA